jgi:hypothetical protein
MSNQSFLIRVVKGKAAAAVAAEIKKEIEREITIPCGSTMMAICAFQTARQQQQIACHLASTT